MKILALNTATSSAGVALVDGERVAAEQLLHTGRGGNSHWLVPAIGRVLEDAGWSPEVLDAVAVNRGPGSFTGIRIGIATAQGLAYGWNKPLLGVNGLEALAWQAVAAAGGGHWPYPTWVLSLMDAGHGNVFAAAYFWEDGVHAQASKPEEKVEPATWPAEEFFLRARAAMGEADGSLRGEAGAFLAPVLAGDGGVLYEALAKEILGVPVRPVPLDGDRLRASTVARWAAQEAARTGPVPQEPVLPLYLRKSEAERKWASRRKP